MQMKILSQIALTKGLEQYFGKPSNSTPSLQKDINMLLEVLKSEQLLKNVPGRQHRSFPAIKCKQTKPAGVKLPCWPAKASFALIFINSSANSPGTFHPVPP
jgi:hypothetical protein